MEAGYHTTITLTWVTVITSQLNPCFCLPEVYSLHTAASNPLTSCHVSPLFKTLYVSYSHVKARLYHDSNALHHLAPTTFLLNLLPLPLHSLSPHSLSSSTSTTPQMHKQTFPLVPLHWLFPLPPMFFPQLITWLVHSNINCSKRFFLTTTYKIK